MQKVENNQILDTRIMLMIFLSILFHIIFFSLSYLDILSFNLPKVSPKEEKKYIEISLQDPRSLKKLKKMNRKAAIKKQIVNNTLDGENVKPKDTRFLGEKNQYYKKQSIAKKVESFNKGSKGSTKFDEISKEASQAKSNQGKKLNLADLSMDGFGKTLIDSSIKKNHAKNEKMFKERKKIKFGTSFGDEKSKGMASNNDYIEDVPLGETTQLNTTEYKYYGFYHRVRQRLEQHWGRTIREKTKDIYKKGRNIQSNRSYITSLTIIMNSKGKIVEVVVNGRSGLEELDQAAVESFNKAGPFPNPPPGMVKKGKVIINWGFVVKS
jgi:TonB family protein